MPDVPAVTHVALERLDGLAVRDSDNIQLEFFALPAA